MTRLSWTGLGLLSVLAVVIAGTYGARLAFADAGEHEHSEATASDAPIIVGDPYPLDFCPVTGEKLGSMGEPVIHSHNGREIRFCCAGCIEEFETNPADYVAKVDEAIIEQQLPYYTLRTCPVTDEDLGSMGEPVNFVFGNRLFRLCCEGCAAEIESNPADYFAKLDSAAVKAQSSDYPLDHCLVLTDEKIGGPETQDVVVGGRLFRLCCPGCVEQVKADPAKWLVVLESAYK